MIESADTQVPRGQRAAGAKASAATPRTGAARPVALRGRCPQALVRRTPPRSSGGTERIQRLTFVLDGIDPCDYLSWGRDPEPPAPAGELLSVAARAEPLDGRAIAELRWAGEPPPPAAAARAAGFLLVPEVVEVRACTRRLHAR